MCLIKERGIAQPRRASLAIWLLNLDQKIRELFTAADFFALRTGLLTVTLTTCQIEVSLPVGHIITKNSI